MASGQPYLGSYGDALLFESLTDPLLARYCPGGVTSERPPEGQIVPLVRFWIQSPGTDKPRQDGRLGRVLSTPTYVVVALDRQKTSSDRVFGTLGSGLLPPQPYLQLAQARIYDLLHGQVPQRSGFSYEVDCFAEYSHVDATAQGWRDVLVGWWVRMNVT